MDIELDYVYDLIATFFSTLFGWLPAMTGKFWTILTRYVNSLINPDAEFGGGPWVLLIVFIMCLSAFWIFFRYKR